MISLKKFLDTDRALEQALRRVVERLLEGIRLHTIETEPDDFAAFRGSIQQIAKAISQTESPEELLVQSGATVKTLEGYARQGAKYFGRRNAEFQNIFKMLTGTIKTISAASDENLRQLREIESRVVSAVQIEDVCLMKSKLSEVLDQIRRESERQKAETSRSVEALNKSLRQAPELDPATGLHGRRSAESALERFCEAEQPWYAAVLVVDSLPSIGLRFGSATANEVLQSFGDFMAQLLSPQDQLFPVVRIYPPRAPASFRGTRARSRRFQPGDGTQQVRAHRSNLFAQRSAAGHGALGRAPDDVTGGPFYP